MPEINCMMRLHTICQQVLAAAAGMRPDVAPTPLADRPGSCAMSEAPFEQVLNVLVLWTHVTGCTGGSHFTQWGSGCTVEPDDERLYRRYSRELDSQPDTSLWMLLYREGYDQLTRFALNTTPRVTSSITESQNGVAVWGENAVWRMYPRLADAVRQHPHIEKEVPYLRNYYWFHAALPLWFLRFGACYPRARFVWRLETDVLWTDTIDTLIRLGSADTSSDVLLPETYGENMSLGARMYFHLPWQTFLGNVPLDKHVYSLVCVGRYSRRFLLDTMHRLWTNGIAGYEELLLPSTCLNVSGCRLGLLNGWTSAASNHVK